MRNVHKIGEKIYIRSDEEIQMNEDAWYLWGDGIYKNKKGELPKSFCKKIILTTDQELIKDGVQSIDDDFLEWFYQRLFITVSLHMLITENVIVPKT